MRYSDKPIFRPSQDLLGRSGFALELARSVDRLETSGEGFVMALLGEWGVGKSSVIELVIRYLRHIEMERGRAAPVRDQVVDALTLDQLEEMAIIFERVEPYLDALAYLNHDASMFTRDACYKEFRRRLSTDEEAEAATSYWLLKCQVDARPRTIVVRFLPWLIAGRSELATALLSDIARAAGEKFGDDVRQAFSEVLNRLSELAPMAGAAATWASGLPVSGLFSGAGSFSGKVAANLSKGPTLSEVRDRLRSVLAQRSDQQILVVVDDLDRLTPPEALEMVALVKSLGDLPNVIYLLGYDERRLAGLVGLAIQSGGRDFLEKIVQYSVSLPPIDEEDLVRMLDADLSALLGELSSAEQRRLGSMWYFVFRYYLVSPRDIRRYVNAVTVRLSALAGRVDKLDALLLELLHMFEPSAYWWIRRNVTEVTE